MLVGSKYMSGDLTIIEQVTYQSKQLVLSESGREFQVFAFKNDLIAATVGAHDSKFGYCNVLTDDEHEDVNVR